MQGLKRKLVFITAYELIGWVISSVALAILSGNSAGVTGPLALAITTIAVSWNFIFNTLFEFWESRQISRIRTFRRRFVHLSLIHISEPTRQAEISYAVFCLKKKKQERLII